jgi:transposase
MSRKKGESCSPEVRLQVVLSVLSGEMTAAEAARRHGVSPQSVYNWRDRFLEAGREALAVDRPRGPRAADETPAEKRIRLENEQLKLALAEATVQLRIWQKGAEHIDQVPSKTSRP